MGVPGGLVVRRGPGRSRGRLHQPRDGGAQMSVGRIPELGDERMAVERLLDDAPLHAGAAPVDQPHLAEPGGMGLADVRLHDGSHVAWRESVQVERGLDRQTVHGGVVVHANPGAQAFV